MVFDRFDAAVLAVALLPAVVLDVYLVRRLPEIAPVVAIAIGMVAGLLAASGPGQAVAEWLRGRARLRREARHGA